MHYAICEDFKTHLVNDLVNKCEIAVDVSGFIL